jgi:hypothetical protein
VSLAPAYEPSVAAVLEKLVGNDRALSDAVADTLLMICAQSADGVGRSHRVAGHRRSAWAVHVPHRDPGDWYVLWDTGTAPDGTAEAVFYYIGPLPHGLG